MDHMRLESLEALVLRMDYQKRHGMFISLSLLLQIIIQSPVQIHQRVGFVSLHNWVKDGSN